MTTTTTKATNARAQTGGAQYAGRQSAHSIAYEKRVAELDAKIAAAKATMDEIRAGGAGVLGLSDEQRAERAKVLDEMRRTGDALRKERETHRAAADEMAKAREEIKRRTGQDREAKERLPFRSIADMEEMVRGLEASVESGSLSLLEEKHALARISALKKARREFEAADAGSDIASLKARLDRLRIELAACDDRTTALRADSDAFKKRLEALSGATADARARREESAAALEAARKTLDSLFEAKRAAYDEYRRAKESAAAARVRRDAQRAEWDRRRELETRLEAAEDALRAFSLESAADVKVAQCATILNYFEPLAPRAAAAAPAAAEKPSAGGRVITLSEDLADAVPIAKKDDADLAASHRRGSKKRGARADSDALAKLPLQILAALAELSLPIPARASDLPALFAAVEAKRLSFVAQTADAAVQMDAKRKVLQDAVDAVRVELENVRATIKKEDAEARAQADAEAAVDAKNSAKHHNSQSMA